MEVLDLGRNLLLASVYLTGLIFVLALLGIVFQKRRFVVGARAGFYALLILVGGSALCLVQGFVAGAYDCEYIYNYSERMNPTGFKIAGLWAGLDGSLLFWTLLVCVFSAAVAFQHRWSSRHPTGRRLEPHVYLALSAVTFFFVLVTREHDPFKVMDFDTRLRLSQGHNIPMDSAGHLLDGSGLNPQLMNYWFVIHPPNLYIGLVGFTVPFAFAIAGLLTGTQGDYWIRIVRRWTLVAWLFLTNGIILGGLWAYRQLGWGGYWAWDPVENASFLPWCTATAFLHSIMITERRDMLKGWNMFLILLTFFMTIVATWMTRSGVVASIHAFAGGGNIGEWFQVFLFVIAGISLFLFFLRMRELRGTDKLEAVWSRESAFFVNNVVLVAIAAAIFFLSFFQKISHDWFARQMSNLSIFNIVMTPCFALLLFLTAIGPGLGWVKTTGASFRRNFLWPIAATLVFTVLLYVFFKSTDRLGTREEVLGLQLKDQHPSALYPTGLFLALSFFIVATVTSELYRGLKSRVRFRKEDIATAFANLVFRQNRRYGGYTVHVGIAILATGIVASSMFQVKEENLVLGMGESARVGPYVVTPVESRKTEPRPGEPYVKDEILFRVTRAPKAAFPVAHGETPSERAETISGTRVDASGEVVAELWCERRFYPKKGEWISEVSIERKPLEDIYIYFPHRLEDGRPQIAFFINPLMFLIYLGWFTIIAGGLFAALPLSGSRVGLSE